MEGVTHNPSYDVPGDLGIALSGGGLRATFFGLGALLFLVDTGLNRRVRTISSVSRGSVLSAYVAKECDFADVSHGTLSASPASGGARRWGHSPMPLASRWKTSQLVAWRRVRRNRGSRSAGVDGQRAYHVEQVLGVERFLAELREELRSGSFRPVAVRERQIPKHGGKKRRLGIPTISDRVVQAALKLVLEPIFEADFEPCSYGFRCTASGGHPRFMI